MNPTSYSVLFFFLMSACLLRAASYLENFTVPGENNVGHSAVGWQAHIGTTGADNSSNNFNSGGFLLVPGDYAAKADTTTPIGIAWTSEFAPFDRSLEEISTLSFISNNTNSVGTMRFAVRIESTWFVTNAIFTHGGGGGQTNWGTTGETELFNFTTAASAWRALNFTAGSTLSVGTVLSSDLPAGNLTAAGILIENNTNIVRYDNFQIQTIPEPTGIALVIFGIAGLTARRKR